MNSNNYCHINNMDTALVLCLPGSMVVFGILILLSCG